VTPTPKERPILFKAPMVRAILSGAKPQTRRIVEPQPPDGCAPVRCDARYSPTVVDRHGMLGPGRTAWGAYDEDGEWGCYAPAQPGDLFWVKETWHPGLKGVHVHRADGPGGNPCLLPHLRWRSPIFMPRWASRIRLRVESVRCERLHDISDADIAAEGMDATAVRALWEKATRKRRAEATDVHDPGRIYCDKLDVWTPRELWAGGWTLICGADSWRSNPLVWAYTFRREG
jgi:hypothetical protein